MSAQIFENNDAGMAGLFQALNEQIGNMSKASSTVEGIRQDISSHFQSDVAATPFLNRINEWQENYHKISNTATEIEEHLTHANQTINTAVSDAGQQGGGWTPTSDLTFTALSGS